MRQFVLGILVALFLWWGYGYWFSESVAAAPDRPTLPPGSPSLGDMLGTGKPPSGPSALATGAADISAAITELLPRVGAREGEALDRAWSALAVRGSTQLPTVDRRRLATALAGTAGDFTALLGQLGSCNTFLHSAEGRALAQKALAAAMALPDAGAVAAGTQLLTLCLRGRIDKGDVEARAFVDEAYRQHRLPVDRWLCDPTNVAGARSYTIAAGDTLNSVSKRFRREKVLVDEGTIAVLNRIHDMNSVQLGQKLKIPLDPVYAVVEKRSFSLVVHVGAHLLRLYWIGHGENDKTPVTEFTVLEKQPKPQWTSPDGVVPYGHPKNILGEYFIKFRHDSYTGFGAHGTPAPETIGTMSSAGCIRMLAPDIAELFQILPRGARVVIKASQATT